MSTTAPSTAVVLVEPDVNARERLALAGFLAGYSGLTRDSYALDLRQFLAWCTGHGTHLFAARRADIERFGRDLEAKGRARSTVSRRLCTVAGFYRYAVEEELLDHAPAVHVRRPRVDYESHATALDRNEVGALLVAAGLGPAPEHALIFLLALNGLRVSEATGANIEALGLERGPSGPDHPAQRWQGRDRPAGTAHSPRHRPRHWGKERGTAVPRPRRGAPRPPRGGTHRAPGRPWRRHHQASRPAHLKARLHHGRLGRRRAAAGRAGSCFARRPEDHHA